MPGGARIPCQWMSILPSGAHLEKDLPGGVENQHVDSPVKQVIRMHFAPRRGPHDLIVLVHYREGLFRPIATVSRGNRCNVISQCNPLPERKFFPARLWIKTEFNGYIFPVVNVFANEFAELLASL